MGSNVSLDLSKVSPALLAALEDAGAISSPPAQTGPVSSPAPAPSAAPQAAPASAATAALAAGGAAPLSTVDKITGIAQVVGGELAQAAPGTLPGAIATAVTLGAGVFNMIWKMFNPHTNTVSYHASAQDAIAAGAAHMQAQQPDAVAQQPPNVAFEVSPVYQVSAADVAAMPKQAGQSSTQ